MDMRVKEEQVKSVKDSYAKVVCEGCKAEFTESELVILDNMEVCPMCHSDKCEKFYVYNLDSMSEMQKIELIKEVEFEVKEAGEGIYRLEDTTGVNLANIESEQFNNIDEIIARLENYFHDYHITFSE